MTTTTFAEEILRGLCAPQKYLSSKYFYDERGDKLFQKIMAAPEYYLTDAEFEIFREQGKDILAKIPFKQKDFELIELGAGDGTKTKELLKLMQHLPVTYKPIDISQNAIENLREKFERELPWLHFEGEQGEYFQVLGELKRSHPKLILFLGSNLGNLKDDRAKRFLLELADDMAKGDLLLLGLDLKKSKEIVLPAYNDKQGYTRDFNLNLLRRINTELGADFNLQNFSHQPEYDEIEGIAKSYLVSTEKQKVFIEDLGQSIEFEEGEKIFMEISRKYDDEILDNILSDSSLTVIHKFTDRRNYFCDYLIKKQ
ncbi:MAG: L-histidine N(alpha)-methyltransferase [Luteibaculum sp.]